MECELCGFWTYYEYELVEHEQEEHAYCFDCACAFRSEYGLRMHCLNSRSHNYCGVCDRDFQSPAALRGHQVTHERRDIMCGQCGRGFPTLSAMTKHVELGKCYGSHTQQQFVKKVRDLETRSGNPNLFTVPRIGHHDDGGASSFGPVQATARTWNGRGYECYLCVREFRSLASLNQHLNSGVHFTTKDFRCRHCNFTATWLSAVIAHMESEKCGFMTRQQVRGMAFPFSQLRIGN